VIAMIYLSLTPRTALLTVAFTALLAWPAVAQQQSTPKDELTILRVEPIVPLGMIGEPTFKFDDTTMHHAA